MEKKSTGSQAAKKTGKRAKEEPRTFGGGKEGYAVEKKSAKAKKESKYVRLQRTYLDLVDLTFTLL